MLGKDFDDMERDGGGCSFGCTCSACQSDRELVEDNNRYSKYESDEQYGYTYRSED